MERAEKSILKGIYAVIIIMFSILSLSVSSTLKTIDYGPILFGVSSCILIGYSNYILKRFFPEGDKFLLIMSVFLTQFGLIMIYRLNPILAIKQISWFTIGVAIFIFLVVFLPDIEKFSKYNRIFLAITIILLLSTLIFGEEIKGSKNWIRIGSSISMQPSELAKLCLIFYLAAVIDKIKDIKNAFIVSIPVFISIGILVMEKDLGGCLIFFGIFMAMLYIGTSNLKYILTGALAFALGGVASYFMFAHVRKRIFIWLDPWKYKFDWGNQICQSLFAIATGGLFGTGLGLGHPQFIPEAHNDFIFAAISEEFGLLGAMAIIILYMLLVYRGLRVAIYAKDNYSRLVAVGITSMIGFQVFVIIGGVIKMIPLTGITLPFISYGGSSMLLNFISLGVLQKISEMGRKVNG